jgi:hypothetical protein
LIKGKHHLQRRIYNNINIFHLSELNYENTLDEKIFIFISFPHTYSIVQTNFSFNGDNSFGSAHGPSSSESDKDVLKSVKIEKDQQPDQPKQVSLFAI